MIRFPYKLDTALPPRIGLIVLQSDERAEQDLRMLLSDDTTLLVSRVPCETQITPDSLAAMETHLPAAAALLPPSAEFDAVAYCCTSGAATIGSDRVAELVRAGCRTRAVTDPVAALAAACAARGLRRLALLSPYLEPVSDKLRAVLAQRGIETPVYGSFAESRDDRVARISTASIAQAAVDLVRDSRADAVFLSCTNLRAVQVLDEITVRCGVPALSSNQVLGWHLRKLAGLPDIAPEPWNQSA